MTPEQSEFRTGVIKPVECLKDGWALIKDQYWLFFGISLVGILIGGTVPVVLMGPMMVGIFLCLLQRQRQQRSAATTFPIAWVWPQRWRACFHQEVVNQASGSRQGQVPWKATAGVGEQAKGIAWADNNQFQNS